MQLRSYAEMNYHPTNELLYEILENKTSNTESPLYFRVLSAFFMSQAASNMRTMVHTPHRGVLPCNMYALLLATSGAGKGHSLNILEDEIFSGFTETFLKETMPSVADKAIEDEAIRKCQLLGTDFDEELAKLKAEYVGCGEFLYTFDSGTGPAYRQVRTAAQISGIGALTMVADEIGRNLLEGKELFNVNLEAYDVGKIKQKLIKNTSENKRSETRSVPVPSNMLCFGTPISLFNGGREENEMNSLFDAGYGRRFMFGIGDKAAHKEGITGEDLIKSLTKVNTSADVTRLHKLFTNLADEVNYSRVVSLSFDVAAINAEYQIRCERRAAELSEYDAVRKAELSHRYFRALKLATAYAFVDGTTEITEEQMYSAIKLVEDSGEAFDKILTRPRNYARLAKYIAEVKQEVTHADIMEDLPFYPAAKGKQEELMSLAVAWGHKNHHIIKRTLMDGIDFFKGEALEETSLDKVLISYSNHEAYNYMNKELKWKQIDQLCQTQGYHWINHFVEGAHRKDENIIAGFNLLIIDCDGEVSLDTAKLFMSKYTSYMYTTKRHQVVDDKGVKADRFRIVLPMKYNLKLSKADYKEFMNNVLEFLPFDSDDGSNQRSKKWMCNKAQGIYNDGELFDPLPFIPKTKKNTDRVAEQKKLGNMDKLQRYFSTLWSSGRNNTLLNYGMMLLDHGIALYDAQQSVLEFNQKFSDPLEEDEINNSIFKTMSQKSV